MLAKALIIAIYKTVYLQNCHTLRDTRVTSFIEGKLRLMDADISNEMRNLLVMNIHVDMYF